MATATQQKALGAFYTTSAVAKFLVRWAVRAPTDLVLDPSCGDGVFLAEATTRLRGLGSKRPEVWGIDISPEAVRAASRVSRTETLLEADFFGIRPEDIPSFTAIVGNPPFVRYQTFNGSLRSAALSRCREAGVNLPQLSSSWAPFLIHATQFLRKGGRLAMVVPAEIGHAKYAREVVRFLLDRFRRISLRMFWKKLFAELSEDTFLLLCEDFGRPCEWFAVKPTDSIERITLSEGVSIPVNIESLQSGRVRLIQCLIAPKVWHLYQTLAESSHVIRLGKAADIGIGYVTGCNDYFHLSGDEAAQWGISRKYLKPALLSFQDVKGLTFSRSDWKRFYNEGKKVYLLFLPSIGEKQFPRSLIRYLSYGKNERVPTRFKCRTRDPWYCVPHVRVPGAFLSYMSGNAPKLIANRANVVAPNTLHVVRFQKGWSWRLVVPAWYSSLTRLSCELEGHALGGGMLKLEPSEAERVAVAFPERRGGQQLISQVHHALQEERADAAAEVVDNIVLRGQLGLSQAECLALREAAAQITAWRLHR